MGANEYEGMNNISNMDDEMKVLMGIIRNDEMIDENRPMMDINCAGWVLKK